jgi:hypothetical protein
VPLIASHCRNLLDSDQRPGERGFGVDVDPLAARGDDAARGRVQALREADTERALFGGGRRVPARFVKTQQLLEVLQAATVVVDAQHLRRRVVVDLDARRAGATGVLQQLGDEREAVGEGVALVAQGAFLVDSNLNLHDMLHGWRRAPSPAG